MSSILASLSSDTAYLAAQRISDGVGRLSIPNASRDSIDRAAGVWDFIDALTRSPHSFLEAYHAHDPAPSDSAREDLCAVSGLSREKIDNWFAGRQGEQTVQKKLPPPLTICPVDDDDDADSCDSGPSTVVGGVLGGRQVTIVGAEDDEYAQAWCNKQKAQMAVRPILHEIPRSSLAVDELTAVSLLHLQLSSEDRALQPRIQPKATTRSEDRELDAAPKKKARLAPAVLPATSSGGTDLPLNLAAAARRRNVPQWAGKWTAEEVRFLSL
eukprot:SAG31_NODE_371_length_16628_cov_3.741943_5_plen_270_part_00